MWDLPPKFHRQKNKTGELGLAIARYLNNVGLGVRDTENSLLNLSADKEDSLLRLKALLAARLRQNSNKQLSHHL